MKPLRLNKVLGLAIGDRALLAAEILAGDRPEVKLLAEMVYPDGVSPTQPQALGAALAIFLRDNKFTAKSAVFGLPARWLVVKAKEVPPADSATLANLLRLQAEGEFSSELKDLVYDYTADSEAGNPKSVLLLATSKRYIDAINVISDAARISPVIVTASAAALGVVTGRSAGAKNPLVLLVNPSGAEITAQNGDASTAIRHLRGPGPDRPFVGELRRAISGMPPAVGPTNGSARELVLWDAAGGSDFNSATLGESLGMPVRIGDLPNLGVDATSAASNGEGRKYAAAVALGLLAMTDAPPPVDFLHSRLAPPKPPLLPEWVMISSAAAIVVIGLVFWAYSYSQRQNSALAKLNSDVSSMQGQVKQAGDFVSKVSFAQAWHSGSPRYLACLRDLTNAIPSDGQTYAMSLTVHEVAPPTNNSSTSVEAAIQAASVRDLAGRLEGKTTDQRRAQQVLDQIKATRGFSEVKPGGTSDAGGSRNREVSFTINFTYTPPKVKP